LWQGGGGEERETAGPGGGRGAAGGELRSRLGALRRGRCGPETPAGGRDKGRRVVLPAGEDGRSGASRSELGSTFGHTQQRVSPLVACPPAYEQAGDGVIGQGQQARKAPRQACHKRWCVALSPCPCLSGGATGRQGQSLEGRLNRPGRQAAAAERTLAPGRWAAGGATGPQGRPDQQVHSPGARRSPKPAGGRG
jgi:hypothetical protein